MQNIGKGLAFGFVVLLAGLSCLAQAQLPMTGAGKGTPGVGGNSVTLDQLASSSASGSTTIVYTSQTISGGLTNPALILVGAVDNATSVVVPVATWNVSGTPQVMTVLKNQDAGGGRQVVIWGLRNPASGNNRLDITGLGTTNMRVRSMSFSHVDPSSDAAAFPNFTGSNSGATPNSITITSGLRNYVVGGQSSTANFSSVSDSQLFLDNGGAVWAVAANYKISTGATDVLTGSPGSATSTIAGGTIAHD